ncbi:MAG: transporter substrate-binding domain-containing protein [Alphaproteobacteria bacterium]
MKHALLTAVIALMATFVGVKVFAPSGTANTAKETAYERVMRTGVLRCGYFIWEPFLFKDATTGELKGFNHDFMEKVGELLGLNIEWVAEAEIGTFAQDLQTHKYDAMCATVWPNAARMKNTLLTVPEVYSVAYAFVRVDDARFDGNMARANAADVRVAIFDGDYTEDVARQDFPNAQTFSMPANATGGDLLLALSHGKVDVAIVDNGIYSQFERTNPNTVRRVAAVKPIRMFGEHVPLPLGEYQLKNMLDVAIGTLNQNGVFDTILQGYAQQGYVLSSFAPTQQVK